MDSRELEHWYLNHFGGQEEPLEADETMLLLEYTDEATLPSVPSASVLEASLARLNRNFPYNEALSPGDIEFVTGFNRSDIAKYFTPDSPTRQPTPDGSDITDDDDDDEWDDEEEPDDFEECTPLEALEAGYQKKPETRVYASLDNNYKTPARYYSVAGVRQSLTETSELVQWLQQTKERRSKLSTVVKDQITLALGTTIAVHEQSSRPGNGRNRYVSLYQLMDRAVKRWADTYADRIAAGTLPALNMHSQYPRMQNQVQAVTVRAIRDELTDYALLHRAFLKKPGLEDTTKILRIKTAVAITDVYPELARAVNFVFYHPQGWDNPPVEAPAVNSTSLPQEEQQGNPASP